MKNYATYYATLLLISTSPAHAATLLTYDRVEAGSGNSFGSNSATSGLLAAGINNTVSDIGAVAIGSANTVASRYALAVGTSNSLMASSFFMGSNSLAVGHGNSVEGATSAVIGQYNTVSADSEFGGGYSTLTAGSFNYNQGMNSIVSGSNNSIPFVDLDGSVIIPSGVALFGRGLIGRDSDCTVVGRNNISTGPSASTSPPLFVVGNGESTSSRSNAFEVRANGDIIISKPQGDISMGIYGE